MNNHNFYEMFDKNVLYFKMKKNKLTITSTQHMFSDAKRGSYCYSFETVTLSFNQTRNNGSQTSLLVTWAVLPLKQEQAARKTSKRPPDKLAYLSKKTFHPLMKRPGIVLIQSFLIL